MDQVKEIAIKGEMIASYVDDKPFPSKLILGYLENQPLHVVIAENRKENRCIVITAYKPDPQLWDKEFKNKKDK